MRGGGIVKRKNSKKYNPSVSFADSSLCTREPFIKSIFRLQKHYKSVVGITPYGCLLQWEKVSPIGDG